MRSATCVDATLNAAKRSFASRCHDAHGSGGRRRSQTTKTKTDSWFGLLVSCHAGCTGSRRNWHPVRQKRLSMRQSLRMLLLPAKCAAASLQAPRTTNIGATNTLRHGASESCIRDPGRRSDRTRDGTPVYSGGQLGLHGMSPLTDNGRLCCSTSRTSQPPRCFGGAFPMPTSTRIGAAGRVRREEPESAIYGPGRRLRGSGPTGGGKRCSAEVNPDCTTEFDGRQAQSSAFSHHEFSFLVESARFVFSDAP